MTNSKKGPNRTLVIPGQLLGEGDLKAGKNTYKRDNKIFATQMGFKTVNQNFVNVIALSGKYIPKPDDLVIGIIKQVSPTSWLVDVNSPYPAPLHVNEVPWRVDFGDTARYLKFGDTILARIFLVDEVKRIQVTMKDQGSRKLSGGQIIEVSPTKVPRVIGKGGSMISLIKQKTMCRLFVGQNGRIWIDGEPENIRIAVNAIRFIERESHRLGLTESVERYLEKVASHKGDADSIIPEIIPPEESKRRSQPQRDADREEEPRGEEPKVEPRVEEPKAEPITAPIQPPMGEPQKEERKDDTKWAPPREARPAPTPVKKAEPVASEPTNVKEDEVAKILSTIPSPEATTFAPVKPAPAAPPLRPPIRPPAGPPRPPMGSPTPTGSTPTKGTAEPAEAGVPEGEQKPKEQILKNEEFERMTE